MWLIVGLGNPGEKYQLTRHNIGFMCVDFMAKAFEAPAWNNEHKALVTRITTEGGHKWILAKPQTYMNLSGDSVQSLMSFYKIPPENILVIQDEIDQSFGKMKFQKNRGHGGHNGIKDITQKIGSNDYIRLRLGVGRPPHPEMAVADYVLQKFSKEELEQLPGFLERGIDGIEILVNDGLGKASSLYNS